MISESFGRNQSDVIIFMDTSASPGKVWREWKTRFPVTTNKLTPKELAWQDAQSCSCNFSCATQRLFLAIEKILLCQPGKVASCLGLGFHRPYGAVRGGWGDYMCSCWSSVRNEGSRPNTIPRLLKSAWLCSNIRRLVPRSPVVYR
jgi:hypothetical protein